MNYGFWNCTAFASLLNMSELQVEDDVIATLKMSELQVEDGAAHDQVNKNKIRKIAASDDDDVHWQLIPLPMKKKQKISSLPLTTKPKPSRDVLGLGGTGGNIRTENCNRLQRLLKKLVRQQNWKEASGVLSMLLKATCKDKSPQLNRFKYSVAIRSLKHIEGDNINSTKIRNIYDIWMGKNGSMKDQPLEDRFEVQLEYIIFCIQQRNLKDAHQAAIGLQQERKFDKDGMSNMVVGLTYYELWYSTIPKEMKLDKEEESYTPMGLEMSGTIYDSISDAGSSFQSDSESSVRIDKIISDEEVSSNEADVKLERENFQQSFEPQSFYINCDENTDNEEDPFSNYGGNLEHNSIFTAPRGLDPLLLPIRLPHSNENLEDFIHLHSEMLNDHYKKAVKYLRVALDSTPPVLEALSPMIQLLMIGDRVREALHLLEKFCNDSSTALPLRLKASLLEHFDRNNWSMISTCYEEILKNDPTCSDSLERLVSMHHNGNYSPESLLEMIALHLDGTYAECNTWREFALCFFKLAYNEEDRMSVCLNGNEDGHRETYSVRYNRIPKVYTEFESEQSWSFRCKWWLRRHFGENMLASEISSGDFTLLTYKAACACHMYGQQFEYVVKAFACLEKENKDMLLILKSHMQNSVGFYSYFLSKTI